MNTSKKIVISAGEVSGDEHAAKVVGALRKLIPNAEFRGMGGRHMRAEQVETAVDSEVDASVMGFGEVVQSLGKIRRSLKLMQSLLKSWRPDLLIVVDYQDFHFRLVRTAKKLKIPVLFFISPSVWAWRSGRIKNVQKYVDCMACIFPFEPDFYKQHGCSKAKYVGHPLIDQIKNLHLTDNEHAKILSDLNLDPNKPVVLLLPGSRKKEVLAMTRSLADGLALARLRHPEIQGVLSVAPGINRKAIDALLPEGSQIRVSEAPAIKLMQFSTIGILKSGTSNLQAAFCQLPFSMIYCGSPLTAWIATRVTSITEFSIVNIIRPHTVKELIQDDVTPENIAKEIERLLQYKVYQKEIQLNLSKVIEALEGFEQHKEFAGTTSVAQRVAVLAKLLIDKKSERNPT